MSLKKYFRIFNHHGGGLRGFKRCLDTFTQVDFFDYKRFGINTRENIRDGYSNTNYMFYAPVYTDVSREMILLANDYWASAIKYTDYSAQSIFIDLGCGSGKTLIQAIESKRFNGVYGVELLKNLSDRCNRNINKVSKNKNFKKPCLNLNVEDESWCKKLIENHQSKNTTLFIFNKNSYTGEVIQKTLDIAEKYFSNIFYLYQNPVASDILYDKDYKLVISDSKSSAVHKNYKYSIFLKKV